MRPRVNEATLRMGVEGRDAQTNDLRAFASSLDERLQAKREERAATMGVSTAVDTFASLFAEEEPAAGNGIDSARRSEQGLAKRVNVLELELHHAREVIASAKETEAESARINVELEGRVRSLAGQNDKLYRLAKYLRHFEKENAELRYIVQGFFASNGNAGNAGTAAAS